ncbi:MAG: sugar ABC transporter substrate-binding protein [Acidimicrobiales bacterium]
MRAIRFVVSAALAALATVTLVPATSSAATNKPKALAAKSSKSAPKNITIGWADPQAKQPIFTAFTEALDAAAKRAHVKIITLNGEATPPVQVSDIQTFITDKVNAIIVFPLVPQAESTILAKAATAGIKIIGLNAILPAAAAATPNVPAPYSADLDWGYVDGPYAEAKFVAQQLHGKGNVVGIKIPIPVPSLNAMLGAYQQYVTKGHPGINWLGTLPDATDDLAGARTSMADAITRYHGNIQAVMAYTDISGIGAAEALAAAGVKHVIIVGQQSNAIGVAALKKGEIQADISTMPYTAALWALKLTQDVVDGKSFPKFARLPIAMLTKKNVKTWEPWSKGVKAIADGKTSLNVKLSNKPPFGKPKS